MENRWERHERITLEDNLSLERIEEYIKEWGELLPSFQRVLVEWMFDELTLDKQSFDNLGL